MNIIDLLKPRENRLPYFRHHQLLGLALFGTVLILGKGNGWPGEFYTMLLITFLGLCMIQMGTILLDQHIRWEDSFAERLVYQLGFCWILPIFFCSYFANDLFCLQRMDLSATMGSKHMYTVIFGLPLLVNFGYIFYSILHLFPNDMLKDEDQYLENDSCGTLVAGIDDRLTRVKFSDIAMVYLEGKDTIVELHNGDTIVLKLQYLTSIESLLNPDNFFRINRNFIISRTAYISHRKHNRGLLIFLRPEGSEPVFVTRYRTKAVLDFLKKGDS